MVASSCTRITPAQFTNIPIFRWAALIKALAVLATNRHSYARQAYAALLLLPSLHLLRFEQLLRQLKRFWNVSTPRYSAFYDCRVLIKTLMSTDFTVRGSPAATRHHHHEVSEFVPWHRPSKDDEGH